MQVTTHADADDDPAIEEFHCPIQSDQWQQEPVSSS